MTTCLLLALTDDGRVTLRETYSPVHSTVTLKDADPLVPVRTGTDRNAYSTYEVAGYSIDVVKLPEEGK